MTNHSLSRQDLSRVLPERSDLLARFYRHRSSQLEREHTLGSDNSGVAVRGQDQSRASRATACGSDGRALAPSGDCSDRRADARSDANFRGVFALGGAGLTRHGSGLDLEVTAAHAKPRQPDRKCRHAFDAAAGVGVDYESFDLRPARRDHLAFDYDGLGQSGGECVASLGRFRRQRGFSTNLDWRAGADGHRRQLG